MGRAARGAGAVRARPSGSRGPRFRRRGRSSRSLSRSLDMGSTFFSESTSMVGLAGTGKKTPGEPGASKQASNGAPASASASMTATDGPLARLTIERHPALGSSAGQHASVDVRGLGTCTMYPSLLLRPLFPNRLVTGVLSHACLGTCVFD